MKGTQIQLSGDPRGRYVEGTISGTPKPGTCMQLQAATAFVNGRGTYEVYNPGADGDPREILVLLEDEDQGKIYSDAYVTGTRGRMYAPMMGDELNMLVKDVSGTGDSHAIGDRFKVEHGSGKLIAQGTSANAGPFQAQETVTAPSADIWLFCVYTGSAG